MGSHAVGAPEGFGEMALAAEANTDRNLGYISTASKPARSLGESRIDQVPVRVAPKV